MGFCVLDLSKMEIYEFHYNFMKAKFPNCRLLFTGTDSLCYEVETEDIYRDLEPEQDRFDFSNYPKTHILFSMKNAKVIGKMKDELGGLFMIEFVGLRPKLYSFIYDMPSAERVEKKTAKGVKASVKERRLRHQNYLTCLKEQKSFYVSLNQIRSDRHILYSVHQRKVGLSSYDTKRWVQDDGISTLAHGHYKTKEQCIMG